MIDEAAVVEGAAAAALMKILLGMVVQELALLVLLPIVTGMVLILLFMATE